MQLIVIILSNLGFVMALFFNSYNSNNTNLTTLQYRITDFSALEINGKTNINNFCCVYDDTYNKAILKYRYDTDYSDIYFDEAKLTIKTKNLDCGKKLINKDLLKTLQADQYPHIMLQLKEIKNSKGGDLSQCDEWFDLVAITDITITCHTNTYEFPIRMKKIDLHNFRVSGQTALQLCDYEIEAPTAMLGLIKVKDTLEINFDLHIEIG